MIAADWMLAGEAIPHAIAYFVFSVGTYLFTAILIWREREHLRDFWIDLAAAITFLLQIFCFPIGIGLFTAMRRHQARFPSSPANVWHVYYLQTEALGPWFIRIMLTSLTIGFIAWRAKSIFASMVTHGMFNASNDMLMHTRSLAEAVKVGWMIVIVMMVIFAGIWIFKWSRHRQTSPQVKWVNSRSCFETGQPSSPLPERRATGTRNRHAGQAAYRWAPAHTHRIVY